jgi:hypothetical protein
MLEAEGKFALLMQDQHEILKDHDAAYFEVLSKPSAGGELGDARRMMLTKLALHLPLAYKLRAVDAWGKYFPWNDELLLFRLDAWRESKHPDLALAEKDLSDYLDQNDLREDDLRKTMQARANGSL